MNKTLFSAHIAYFNKENEILLVKRRDVPVWVIPGGWGEKKEQPVVTACREFKEETGIALNQKDVTLVATYLPKTIGKRTKYLYFSLQHKKIQPQITDESSAYGFFSLDNLPELISVYEESRITDAYTFLKSKKKITRIDAPNYRKELAKLCTKPLLLFSLVSQYFLAALKRKL